MRESGVFWGVILQNPGCDAAMELFEKNIPLTEAPDLPLQGCDAAQCSCSWKGLTEQRHETRRTHHDRRDSVRFEDQEHTDRLGRERLRFAGHRHSITGIRPDRLASRGVAFVPQAGNVFTALTVEQNLVLAARRMLGERVIRTWSMRPGNPW